MDVTLQKYSLYDLPSQLRVDALVHDGSADMQLWPGPGPDTDLRAAWGDDLQGTLDTELRQVNLKRLDLGQPIRVARGRLHCDFLVWVASREPEPGTERSDAPGEADIRNAVKNVLTFVAERSVARVAFLALGHGKGEVARVDRIVAIAKAAQEYEDACRAAGRSPVVEEVLICEADQKLFSLSKARLGSLARAVEPPKAKVEPVVKAPRKTKSGDGKAPAKRGAPRLSADEIDAHRLTSQPYSMRSHYGAGQYFLHARFGVGRVETVLPEGAVVVVFEDGETRKMVHGRV